MKKAPWGMSWENDTEFCISGYICEMCYNCIYLAEDEESFNCRRCISISEDDGKPVRQMFRAREDFK